MYQGKSRDVGTPLWPGSEKQAIKILRREWHGYWLSRCPCHVTRNSFKTLSMNSNLSWSLCLFRRGRERTSKLQLLPLCLSTCPRKRLQSKMRFDCAHKPNCHSAVCLSSITCACSRTPYGLFVFTDAGCRSHRRQLPHGMTRTTRAHQRHISMRSVMSARTLADTWCSARIKLSRNCVALG